MLVFDQYFQTYGDTFSLYVGGTRRSILTINPEVARHVLQKNHRNYQKSAIQTDQLAQFIGRGLLTNDGDDWLRQRRLIQPGFHRERLANIVGIMDQAIHQIGDELAVSSKKESVMDFYPLMLETAFRIIGRAIFSTEVHGDRLLELSDNITRLQEYIVYAIRLPFLRPYYKLIGKERAMHQLREDSFSVLNELIEQRKREKEAPDDLLQMLLDSRYEDTGEPMDARRLLEEMVVLFVAGHETSANALAWIFYLLAQHPEVVERLRTEWDEQGSMSTPSLESLRNMRYTTQVIKEGMRLYPPAWITDRLSIGADEVASYKIPPKIVVAPFIYGIHRNPAHWDQPHVFNPDRFTAAAEKERHPYAYMPFGGGPRLCIGNNFAMLEMQLVLQHFLGRFDISLANDQPVEAFPLVTLRPKPGVLLRIRNRREG